MSSDNVTLHPVKSGEAAKVRACPERAERVERETSLNISDGHYIKETVRDSSTSVGMTKAGSDSKLICVWELFQDRIVPGRFQVFQCNGKDRI